MHLYYSTTLSPSHTRACATHARARVGYALNLIKWYALTSMSELLFTFNQNLLFNSLSSLASPSIRKRAVVVKYKLLIKFINFLIIKKCQTSVFVSTFLYSSY